MKWNGKVCPVMLLIVVPTWASAENFKVARTLQVPAPLTAVWNHIGDFCDIDDWHPLVQGCAIRVIDGRLHRVLTMHDGETFTEQRIAEERGLSYTYKVTDAPLPMENFVATISVEPIDGTQISWSVNYSSSDPATEAIVIELIETGFAEIEKRFGAN